MAKNPSGSQRLFGALTFVFLANSAFGAGLQLQLSNETVPPGGVANIKITPVTPQPIGRGRIVMDFDPAIFGTIAGVSVFSVNGDAAGAATVRGQHLEVTFSSNLASIGRSPGLPIVQVSISVLPTASRGTTSTIAFNPANALLGPVNNDPANVTYAVSVIPGTLTVGGTLSVGNVSPGGGVLPAGASVQIDGSGFSASSTLQVDGVAVASVQAAGPDRINFTLAALTEMTGKRILIGNPDGTSVEYFSSLRGAPVGPVPTIPIFPLTTLKVAAVNPAIAGSTRYIAIQNQTSDSVSVTVITILRFERLNQQITIDIPGGATYAAKSAGTALDRDSLRVIASAPVRMVELDYYSTESVSTSAAVLAPFTIPPLQLTVSDATVNLEWQIGTAPPTKIVNVAATGDSVVGNFTASAVTSSGAPWLAVSPGPIEACNSALEFCNSGGVTLTTMPAGLAPGTYTGSVTLTPLNTAVPSKIIPVSLIVKPANLLTVCCNGGFALWLVGVPNPNSHKINVTTSTGPAKFNASISSQQGGDWFSISAVEGTTPASILVTPKPGLLNGMHEGTVTVSIPGDTKSVKVSLWVYPLSTPLRFAAKKNFSPLSQGFIAVPEGAGFAVAVSTDNGGPWLLTSSDLELVRVSVQSQGLAAGTYTGAVKVTTNGITSAFPVTLSVYDETPQIVVTPSSLVFADSAQKQTLTITAGGLPVSIYPSRGASDPGLLVLPVGCPGVDCLSLPNLTAPATLTLSASSSSLGSQTLHGSIIFQVDDQTVTVPITVNNPSNPPFPPFIGSIVSAASGTQGAIAPGELIAVHGIGIGPPGNFNRSSFPGVRVLFDGIPGEVVFGNLDQLNVVAPLQLIGKDKVAIQTEYFGLSSEVRGFAVAPATPGIFTADSTGVGQAAVLNQDNTANGSTKPAARGSIIQIFATGAGVSGETATVEIGGAKATVVYAGQAPRNTIGLFQVNAVVPSTIDPGPAVPIILKVGSTQSQSKVTVAIE